jgi:hypothetical protein
MILLWACSNHLALRSCCPSHPDSFLLTIPGLAFNTPEIYPRNPRRRSQHSLKDLIRCRPRADTLLQTCMFDQYQPARAAPSPTNPIPNSLRNPANEQTRTMKIIATNSNPSTPTQPRSRRRNTSDGRTPLPLDVVEQGEPMKPCHCAKKIQGWRQRMQYGRRGRWWWNAYWWHTVYRARVFRHEDMSRWASSFGLCSTFLFSDSSCPFLRYVSSIIIVIISFRFLTFLHVRNHTFITWSSCHLCKTYKYHRQHFSTPFCFQDSCTHNIWYSHWRISFIYWLFLFIPII